MPNTIRGYLVAFLSTSDGLSEVCVEVLEVNGEVAGVAGGNFLLGMNGDVRVISLVGEEGGDAGGSVRSVVVGKLCEGEKTIPIVLLVGTIHSDVLLEGLVGALGLSVGLRVMSRGEVEVNTKEFAEGAHEHGDKLGAPIGGEVIRNSVLGEDVDEEKVRKSGGVDGVVTWNEDTLFRGAVNDNEDGCEPIERGRCSMKSAEIVCHGRSGTGRGRRWGALLRLQ